MVDKLPEHVQRMAVELDQLNEKYGKLSQFMATSTFKGLDSRRQSLMAAQHGAMGAYVNILALRIELDI